MADAIVIAGADGAFFNAVKVTEQAVVERDFQSGFENCIFGAEKFDAHSIKGFVRSHAIHLQTGRNKDRQRAVKERIALFPAGEQTAQHAWFAVGVFKVSLAVGKAAVGGSHDSFQTAGSVDTQTVFIVHIQQVALIVAHVVAVQPVDHHNILRNFFEDIGIKFKHIRPEHNAFAAGSHNIADLQQVLDKHFLLIHQRGHGFFAAFAQIEIPEFIQADVEPFAGEKFSNFFEISTDEIIEIRVGNAEREFAGTAETADHIALQFRQMFQFFVAQEAFRVTQSCNAGNHFHIVFGSEFDNAFDVVSGVDFVVRRQLITGGFDAVFQIEQQTVVAGIGQQHDEFFDEFHSFHLTRHIQLRPANIKFSHNNTFLYFIIRLKKHTLLI